MAGQVAPALSRRLGPGLSLLLALGVPVAAFSVVGSTSNSACGCRSSSGAGAFLVMFLLALGRLSTSRIERARADAREAAV